MISGIRKASQLSLLPLKAMNYLNSLQVGDSVFSL